MNLDFGCFRSGRVNCDRQFVLIYNKIAEESLETVLIIPEKYKT